MFLPHVRWRSLSQLHHQLRAHNCGNLLQQRWLSVIGGHIPRPRGRAVAGGDWVSDGDGLLETRRQELNALANKIYVDHGVSTVVVAVAQLESGVATVALRQYVVDLFTHWGVGLSANVDGMMVRASQPASV